MWQSLDSKLHAVLARYMSAAADQPVLLGIFAALLVSGTLAVVVAIVRGRSRQAYWCGVALVVGDFLFAWGDDTYTHVFRIAAIADQLREGAPSLMLIDPASGEGLPTFVYYSIVPYLLPVLLDLVGVPAVIAFKVVGALLFVVMAAGLGALIEQTSGDDRDRGRKEYLVALLFVSAGYVYALWCTRASLAEFWVASLIPWTARYLVVPDGRRPLVVLFALQAAGHPIVLLHGLIGALPVAWALARTSLLEMARRAALPLLIALVLASPYWLPQFFWQTLILGPAALPTKFADTFLALRDLVDPRHFRNIGPWMPLGIAAFIFVARGRMSLPFWLLAAATAGILAIETTYLRPAAVHLPMLALSLFVWRLLFPAAFLAFGTLLVGVRDMPTTRLRGLAPLAILSVLSMVWVMASLAPGYLPKLTAGGSDRQARAQHYASAPVWGVREFKPDTARLPRLCPADGDLQRASYLELRGGLTTERAFIAVPQGPIGIVDYRADGRDLAVAACGEKLVLGPLQGGARLQVDESRLDWLLLARLVSLGAMLVLPFAWSATAIAGRTSRSRGRSPD